MPTSPKIHHGNSTPLPDNELASLIAAHPKPSSISKYSYGTAGFRYDASLLPCCFVRMGMFAALRSASLGGEDVGAMITASHNAEPDNGMKLADSHGGMLDADWEGHAVSLANAPTSKHALALIKTLSEHAAGRHGAVRGAKLPRMVVHVGRDTRSHSPELASLVVRAARAIGATVVDHGVVSTPMLHHCVMHANGHLLPSLIPQRVNEMGYYEIMSMTYAALLRTGAGGGGSGRLPSTSTLIVDGACGVGAMKIEKFQRIFAALRSAGGCTPGVPEIKTVNFPGDGPLNENCGAEFVQKQQLPPRLYSKGSGDVSKRYMTSYDGDADRVVFHYEDEAGKFHLLDGDKIAVLVSSFIQDELRCLDPDGTAVKCGVVQTAYANGSSTMYLKVSNSLKLLIRRSEP